MSAENKEANDTVNNNNDKTPEVSTSTPRTPRADSVQKKACQPAILRRAWHATRRSISLEYSPPHQFACCQWQRTRRPPGVYLAYRCILLIIVVSIGIASFSWQRLPPNYKGPMTTVNRWKWFIYLTSWGFLMIILQTSLALAVLIKYRSARNMDFSSQVNEECSSQERQSPTPTPLLCRLYRLSHVVATDLAFVITLVYWALVHNPEIHRISAINILVHGANSMIMLTELLVTSHPIRAAHALYCVCFGLVYGLFSFVYWAAGGTDRFQEPTIYRPLNWASPAKAVGFVCVCMCVMLISHMFVTLIATLRMRIAARYFHQSSEAFQGDE